MDFDNLERLRRARAPKAPKMMAQPLGRLHVVEAGSAPMLAMILVAVRLLGKIRRSASPDPLAVAALGLIVAETVHALGDFSLEITGNLYFFLAVLALGLAERRTIRTTAAKEPAPL